MSNLSTSPPNCGYTNNCVDTYGCPANVCPDFQIKQHDTKPSFKVSVEDDDAPIDLTDLVLEASMWANAKLRAAITDVATSIELAGDIGFEQVLVGDVILMERTRSPEKMLITAFDEVNKTITVTRGYDGTTAAAWKKGQKMKIFRFINSPGVTEMVVTDVEEIDGSVSEDQLQESYFVYEWSPNDTCAPGCFWLEFKLMKMMDPLPSPSPLEACDLGLGVEWARRYPACGEFLIKICESPTAEV